MIDYDVFRNEKSFSYAESSNDFDRRIRCKSDIVSHNRLYYLTTKTNISSGTFKLAIMCLDQSVLSSL